MLTLTVVCKEEGFEDILIYTIRVQNPDDRLEIETAIEIERAADLGSDTERGDMVALFAFQGDIAPRVDWRD